jgi:hypothetical protein
VPRLPEIFERNDLPEDKRDIYDCAMLGYTHNAIQVRLPDR